MNIPFKPLAATFLAVVLVCALPRHASVAQQMPTHSVQVERTNHFSVSAERTTTSRERAEHDVLPKSSAALASFIQGEVVKNEPSVTGAYNNALYFFKSKADKPDSGKSLQTYYPQTGKFRVVTIASKGKTSSDTSLFFIYKGKLYVRVPGDSGAPAQGTGYTLWGSISLSRHTGDRILSVDGVALGDA